MHVADLLRLFEYHYWANAQLSTVLGKVTTEEYVRDVAGGHGSLRNTLVHVVSAEWGWLERCGGPTRGPRLTPADYPTLSAISRVAERVERDMRVLLRGLRDEDLAREVTFTLGNPSPQRAQRGELLLHAAVHAVHHRGQMALLLRALGHEPGTFDLLIFVSRSAESTS
jgi:uncharacterized damage-inducible protein DinB